MEFKPHIVIIAIIFGGLFSWLRYVALKREVGRSTAKQMMPFELIENTVISLLLGVLFSLTRTAENMVWLITAAVIPPLITVKVIGVVLPRSTSEAIVLEPDPANKHAGWWAVLSIGASALSLIDYFSDGQSDHFRLAYSAAFLAIAASHLIRRFKPTTLTETGYYDPDRNLRWSDIEAYQWLGKSATHDLLVYRHKTRWGLRIASISTLPIPAANRPRVDEFLSRYVAPTATLAVILD